MKRPGVLSGRSTEEIAETMHVAPASVYTMKYRIKKKYPESFPLPFLTTHRQILLFLNYFV